MAYTQKIWKNRQSEYPNRRVLTPTGNADEYDVARSEGVVTEEGDLLDADNLNDLESRIKAGFEEKADFNNGIHTYTHTKSGTVHNLTGPEMKETIGNIRFVATADWNPGDTLTINGINARCHNTVMERVENDVLFKQYARLELTVAYTVNGYYSCFFKSGGGVPDGLTALPVNNVLIWQRCAGLKTSYTTVAQVLADTATLKALINSANAMEYLIRSTAIQEVVLANSTAVLYLDESMPFINPDMATTSLPYGTVTTTSDNNGGDLFKAFNTNESSGYIASGAGKYIEWKTSGNTKGRWGYKVTAQDTYGTDAQVKFQGIDIDGNVFDMTDTITLPKNTLMTVTAKPTTKRIVGFRVYIVRASQGSNNWIYLKNCKVYGI